jgi:hypothetical protein
VRARTTLNPLIERDSDSSRLLRRTEQDMRAETVNLVEEIKQSVRLLRRHL